MQGELGEETRGATERMLRRGRQRGEQSWAFRKISNNCKEQGAEKEKEEEWRSRDRDPEEFTGNWKRVETEWRVVEKRGREKKKRKKKKEARVTRTGEGKAIDEGEGWDV